MPLASLNLYLIAKHEHEAAIGQNLEIYLMNREYELKRDAYMLDAMRSLLTLPPDSYYKEYTDWRDIISGENQGLEFVRTNRPRPRLPVQRKEEYDEQDVIDMFRGKKKL